MQYKLSLYQQPDGSSRFTLHAKLLSQRERLVTSSADEVGRIAPLRPPSSILHPAPLLAIIAFGLLLTSLLRRQSAIIDSDLQYGDFAISSFFSFRPPPVAA